MIRDHLTHEFVEFIPEQLQEGTIYISIPFATAAHKCGCGCGNEVVTPLSPTDWTLTFNGRTISLDPSIGNWSFPCQSHYWITNNRVEWARRWSSREIAAGRAADRHAKAWRYKSIETPAAPAGRVSRGKLLWRKLRSWF